MANQPKADRAYAAAHFAFTLEKEECGVLRSIEGGGVKVDATTYRYGFGHETWRQLGKPKFENIKLQVGMSMAKPFYAWIEQFFTGKTVRKDGAIHAADFQYKERARREFTSAIISEVTLPALNAADKNAAYMGVTIAAEKIVFVKGDLSQLGPAAGMEKQKLWTCCHFNFTIDGFDDQCRRVSKVDAATIKMNVIEHHVGGYLEPYKFGSRIDYPNLSFTLPEADFQPIADQAQAYWNEKKKPANFNGHIDYLDNELKPLGTLQFTGANVISVTPDRSDATTEEMKMVKVEMYTEGMTLTFAG
jgi:phage tail-like protein